MSFILNALRKSERERQALQPDTVTDRILVQHPQPSRNKKARFFAFLIIGNVLIISCATWWFIRSMSPSPETSAQIVAQSIPAQTTNTNPKSIAEVTLSQNSLAKKARQKTPSIAEWAETKKPLPAPVPAPTAKTAVDKIKPLAIAKSELPLEKAPAIANPPHVPEAMPVLPVKTAPVKRDIPFLTDLPFEFRQTIPKFNINVFVYSQQPEERFVMIDMVKYKTGQQIKDSMVLKDIRPDSLVVMYNNQVFQIERP